MSEPLRIRVYGYPVAQGRPRFTTRGGFPRAYDPANSRDWKRTVHSAASEIVAQNSARFPMQGPLAMRLTFHLLRPTSLPKKVLHHTKRPDADNLCKAVKDSLSGCVYRDDAQIVALTVFKGYGPQPGVEIEVQELTGAELVTQESRQEGIAR